MLAKLKRPGGVRGTLLLASTATLVGLTLLHQRRSPPESPALPDPAPDSPRPEQAGASFGLLSHLSKQVIYASLFAVMVLAVATAVPAVAALAQGQPLLRLEPAFSGIAATGVRPRPFAQIQLLRIAAAQSAQQPAPQQQLAAEEPAPPPAAEEPAPLPTAEPAPAAPVKPPPQLEGGRIIPGARITFYTCVGGGFCGNMSSGHPVHEGAAACGYDLPLGTRFTIAGDPSGRVYECLDRGLLSPTQVDVWFHDAASGWLWQSQVGSWSDIIIHE